MNKINIFKIVKDHINTLKDYNTQKTSISDILIFFLVPLITSIVLVSFRLTLKTNLYYLLITSLSIFAALLFNLLLLMYDIVKNHKRNPSSNSPQQSGQHKGGKVDLKLEFLKQIYTNISFEILVSVITVLLLVLDSAININQLATQGGFAKLFIYLYILLNFVIYFLLITFFLTLLMILKRFHILLNKEFE